MDHPKRIVRADVSLDLTDCYFFFLFVCERSVSYGKVRGEKYKHKNKNQSHLRLNVKKENTMRNVRDNSGKQRIEEVRTFILFVAAAFFC